jgi:hypothetical protein
MSWFDVDLNRQVTLVQGLAQLFLVEIALLNNYQAIDLYNLKKQKSNLNSSTPITLRSTLIKKSGSLCKKIDPKTILKN